SKGETIMGTFIKRALLGTLLAGGITLLGATVAHAADTTGEDGLLSGTQALLDVKLPVTISGTSLSVIGDSTSQSAATSAPAPAPAPAAPAPAPASTSGENGVASGTQALVTVTVPVTVSGNAISVVGDSSSSDAATAAPAQPAASSSP